MKNIEILLSSYNGAKTIRNQIESILNQRNVAVHLTIRDDGSFDETCKVVDELSTKYPDSITLIRGQNCGWKKSFLALLRLAKKADYYGFSDQDDIWMPEKLFTSISIMEEDGEDGIKLIHVNSICTNEQLKIQKEQQKRYSQPKNHKAVIAQEYFQGCSMLWNNQAMEMLRRYIPQGNVAHDFWVGIVCYYLGKIYYCDTPLFYHIRYVKNSSSDGNVNAGRKKRMKMIASGETVYMNPAQDLLCGYSDLISGENLRFLKDVVESRNSFLKRMKLICMPDFRRENLKSTCIFKLMLLLGKY